MALDKRAAGAIVGCFFLGVLTVGLLLFGWSPPATEWRIDSEAQRQLRNLLEDTSPQAGTTGIQRDVDSNHSEESGKKKLLAIIGIQVSKSTLGYHGESGT